MVVNFSWIAIFGMLFVTVIALPFVEKTAEKNEPKNGDLAQQTLI